MINSKNVDSTVFRRLTNRIKPSLVHPTSKRFDFGEWEQTLASETLNDRDVTLVNAAALIGSNLKMLRERYIRGTFDGLSGQDIIYFALADANRGWMILREKVHASIQADAEKRDVGYLMTVGHTPLDVGPGTGPLGADVLTTTMIDSLPHWFAQGVDAPETATTKDFEYNRAAPRAQAALSLEHALREVWQEILWEPWIINREESTVLAVPLNPNDQSLWSVWDWREQALMLQAPLLNRHLEGALGLKDLPGAVTRTVVALETGPGWRRIVTGRPTNERAAGHRSSIESLESAYFALFMDQPLGRGSTTPRELQRAVCVLQDLVEIMLPPDSDSEYRTAFDISRLSCSITFSEIVLLFVECLSVSAEHAVEITLNLTSNPFNDLAATFRNSLYHRPLVMSRDGGSFGIVVGALVSGSPVRRVERWLKDGLATDLSETSIGLQYEAQLRGLLQSALEQNDILRSVCGPVSSIPAGKATEEIDGILRLGGTILVLEIKCLITPSDPIDRYDYVVKLEGACEQAIRKANWIRENLNEATIRVGQLQSGIQRVVPLVVVNQGNGSGCRIGECVVIDAHFFVLYLSTGEYRSGGAIAFSSPGQLAFTLTKLYSSASEAESGIPGIFESHPGLEVYRAAVRWQRSHIPLANGETLFMSFPTMDSEAYIDAVRRREIGLPF